MQKEAAHSGRRRKKRCSRVSTLKSASVFRLGQARFVVSAVLKSEPDRLGVGIGLGPRLLISQAALDATSLVQPGSLVRWTTRVIMDGPGGAPDEAAVQALLDSAKRTFPQAGWETRTRLNVSPDFTRDLDRFAEFLTLSGLLSLVVGGVGVANAAQGFVERKRASLAILKAIGASGTSVVVLALVEFLIVAFAGALAGAALGAAIPFVVNGLLRRPPSGPPRALGRPRCDGPRACVRASDSARVFDPAVRPGARAAGHHA